MNEESKPCAFCGGKGRVSGREIRYFGRTDYGAKRIRYGVQVICGSCKARGPLVVETIIFGYGAGKTLVDMKREAIVAWNRRTNDGMDKKR